MIKRAYRHIRSILVGDISSSVNEALDLTSWQTHHFGLTPERFARLKGKVFWITGAGSGYGRSVAIALVAAGSTVILSGRKEEKLRQTVDDIGKSLGSLPNKAHIIPFDLTRYEDCADASRRLRETTDELHGIVHCAALSAQPERSEIPYPLDRSSIDAWDKTMATNVRAPWLLTRDAFPLMLKGGEAKVVFFTSGAGWASTPGKGIYNVSKAALNSLSHSMAREYATHYPDIDIQINAIVPGEARTEMNPASTTSPFSVASLVLALLSHPRGGPNGRFFTRDGKHIGFGDTRPYDKPLI